MKPEPCIDHLHHVTLVLTAKSSESHGSQSIQHEFTFIYGIGTLGLSTFEQRLHAKGPGDKLSVHVNRQTFPKEFEHLGQPVINNVATKPPFDLHIVVQSVRKASDLEVLKALARVGESGGCGDGCGGGCDCGC